VTHPARPGIRDCGQHRQQSLRLLTQRLRGGQQLANRGVDRNDDAASMALSSDPAGAGAAIIASGAVPAPLPAHIDVSPPAKSPSAGTLPTPVTDVDRPARLYGIGCVISRIPGGRLATAY